MVIPNLKTCYLEDIETKYKSQALHIIRIKYWKVGESGNLPFPIPALWKIGILLHKQATYSDFIYIEFFFAPPPVSDGGFLSRNFTIVYVSCMIQTANPWRTGTELLIMYMEDCQTCETAKVIHDLVGQRSYPAHGWSKLSGRLNKEKKIVN